MHARTHVRTHAHNCVCDKILRFISTLITIISIVNLIFHLFTFNYCLGVVL